MQRVSQAGVVAFRTDGAEPRYLVVTARKTPDAWIFPKGHVEPGETLEEAALREAREEAGVVGRARGPAGELRFRSGDEDVAVTYFAVERVSDVAAEEGRELRWLPYGEARARLTHDDARRLLDRVATILGAG